MPALRYAKHTRALKSTFRGGAAYSYNPIASLCACVFVSDSAPTSQSPLLNTLFFSSSSSESIATSKVFQPETVNQDDVVGYFRGWFQLRKKPLFEQIFEILRSKEGAEADSCLSRLHIQLTEALVIDVLNYDKNDVLSCLKFFDWAGRQSGFHHTKVTFKSIFGIISKAKKMDVMMDFLKNYEDQMYVHNFRYNNILVMGYAVAGKPAIALQILGKMRFRGLDLDPVAYHVLMNSLVEEGLCDVVEILAKHVKFRGYENEFTHSIMIRNFCKQNDFERGAEYLKSLVKEGNPQLSGAVGTFVDALCKNNQFQRAAKLVEEFRSIGFVPMQRAYGAWISNLVQVGELDGALDFLKDKQVVEGYVPDVFRYNTLLYRLLRENRIVEAYDLLVDMKESHVLPDNITMNAVLCFLCKAGMMDVALQLYESRSEIGLTVNFMAYNYLINALVGDVKVDEAYQVLRNSIERGILPGNRTLSILVDALCREGKIDKMTEIVQLAVQKNIRTSHMDYDNFISALCRDHRAQEGYFMHLLLSRWNKKPHKSTYKNLISGLAQSSRGDVAASLFIEMQEKGYKPTKTLVRQVIAAITEPNNREDRFFSFLERQLDQCQSSFTYDAFIDGAGHIGKPELALQVYLKMKKGGIEPTLRTHILLLRSYIKGGKFSYAVQFFRDLLHKWPMKKLWKSMIVGVSQANQPEIALSILHDMIANGMMPSIECYEELIKSLCEIREYRKAICLLNDMTQNGRPISSFIGNTFLFHALRTRSIYTIWVHLGNTVGLNYACSKLGHAVGVFCGAIEAKYDCEELGGLISQNYHIDMFTNNILLRRIGMSGVDRAIRYLDRLIQQGYMPNRWTYDIIVHGLIKEGRGEEAQIWIDKMEWDGFSLTSHTRMKCIVNQFLVVNE